MTVILKLNRTINIVVYKHILHIIPTRNIMRRNIIIILSKMLEEFPNEITIEKLKRLKHHFEKTNDSLTYSPPETINSSYYWNIVGDYLNNCVSQEDYKTIPWIKNVIDIFMDKIKV